MKIHEDLHEINKALKQKEFRPIYEEIIEIKVKLQKMKLDQLQCEKENNYDHL